MTTARDFMAAAPRPLNSNTPWGSRYAAEVRRVVNITAAEAPRSQQIHLGPSEIGHACDRNVVGKLAGVPRTNHVMDPWPSIVGTAVHAWLEAAFRSENGRLGRIRWVPEARVTPIDGHAGTADLYDADEQSVDDHKGVWVDTPIATPNGWTTMGQLAVGDEVFGADGKPHHVTKVYPVQQRDCYRIRFVDGTELVTDDVQELPFVKVIRAQRLQPMTLAVTEAPDHMWTTGAKPQRRLRVYNAAPLALPDRDLAVHPYVFGCWLGDGGVHGGQICKPDDELFQNIEACGYTVSAPIGQRKIVRTVYGLSTQLQQLGLQWMDPEHPNSHGRLAGHKLIPDLYLRASRGQRLALLQGLMDTDGTWNRPRNQAVFTTTDKGLATGVAELVVSLGWKPKIFPQQAHGFGVTVTAYHVSYTPFDDNPFRLSRKADLVRLSGTVQAHYRTVDSITPTVSVPTRCIDVDSPDRLYLCGTGMVPVHNCLGPTSMAKVRSADGPPIHYVVQLLLYAQGFRRLGLPVRRVALLAYPRTAATLDGLYVWDRPHTPADDELLQDVTARLQVRKDMAALVRVGACRLNDIPATPDDTCVFCPFYRPQSARDGGLGCPGPVGTQSAIALTS